MKKIDPNREIGLALPIRLFLNLWHFMNVNVEEYNAFVLKMNDRIYSTIPEPKDIIKINKDWQIIDKELRAAFGVDNIDELVYEEDLLFSFKLTDNLQAEVVGKNIKVGCKTIPIKKVKELLYLIKQEKDLR